MARAAAGFFGLAAPLFTAGFFAAFLTGAALPAFGASPSASTLFLATSRASFQKTLPCPTAPLAADDPLVQYDGANLAARRFLETDHQGSIIHISDNAGATIAINKYDEYGRPATTNAGRFCYTGQQSMGELSLTGQPHAFYYYKARIYRADIGRFLQVDPIGYDDQWNLYAYVGGDPVNRTDPSGQCMSMICLGSIGRAIEDDPGILIDVGAVIFDIANFPSGESVAMIGARRAARESVETTVETAARVDRRVGPGPHARESIPAQSGRPTAEQQREINRIGQEHGCHTCGTRDPGTKKRKLHR